MIVLANNVLVGLTLIAGCLCLVLMNRAKGERWRMIWGGAGVAAAIVVAALLADAFSGTPK